MIKNSKNFRRIIARLLVFSTLISFSQGNNIIVNASTVNDSNTISMKNRNSNTYGLVDNIEDGTMLHAWNWSFNSIKNNLDDIAKAGYTSVQVSPIQRTKEDSMENCNWWLLYQPVDLKIGNKQLGTREEFKSMCTEAKKYGVKIIVDVVTNHTANNCGDGNVTINSLVPFKDNKDFWHQPMHGVTDWNDRYEVTHGGVGLPDLDTSNHEVQVMVHKFLQDCLDCGADGLRFDTTKHIELPTDDEKTRSDFWPNVLKELKTKYGESPYVYGEVLQGGADAFSDYAKIMDVTASDYGNDIRKAVGLGCDADVSKAIDYDIPSGLDASNIVTWVESHDTYANDSGASVDLTEDQIKNAWALIAARDKSTPLYFNRRAGRKKLQGNMGPAGNDSWKEADVVAVNKFHNAMVGEKEKLNEINKEIMMIERGNKGVTIVNLGNDTEINHLTNLANGTYKNCATTGGEFKVENGVIIGNLSKGITVLYDGGNTEKPIATPKVSSSKEDCSFDGTIALTLNAINTEKATYSINGGVEKNYTDGTVITIGDGYKAGDKIKIVVKGFSGEKVVREEYTYTKKESNSIATIYFEKPDGWKAPYVYINNELGEDNGKWPGVKMTKIDKNLYKYELKGFTNAKVMFNDWFYGNNKTKQFDLSATGKMIYADNEWIKSEDYPTNPDVEQDEEEKGTSKVYFQKPKDWKTDDINIYFYKNGSSGPSWPGVPMEKVDGKKNLYTYTLPKGLEGAMVIFNTDEGKVQVPKDAGFNAPADSTMIYDNGELRDFTLDDLEESKPDLHETENQDKPEKEQQEKMQILN